MECSKELSETYYFIWRKHFTNCKQRLLGYYIPMRLQPPPGVMRGAKPCNSKRGQQCKNATSAQARSFLFHVWGLLGLIQYAVRIMVVSWMYTVACYISWWKMSRSQPSKFSCGDQNLGIVMPLETGTLLRFRSLKETKMAEIDILDQVAGKNRVVYKPPWM